MISDVCGHNKIKWAKARQLSFLAQASQAERKGLLRVPRQQPAIRSRAFLSAWQRQYFDSREGPNFGSLFCVLSCSSSQAGGSSSKKGGQLRCGPTFAPPRGFARYLQPRSLLSSPRGTAARKANAASTKGAETRRRRLRLPPRLFGYGLGLHLRQEAAAWLEGTGEGDHLQEGEERDRSRQRDQER